MGRMRHKTLPLYAERDLDASEMERAVLPKDEKGQERGQLSLALRGIEGMEYFNPSLEGSLCKSSVLGDNTDKRGVYHGGHTQARLCGHGPGEGAGGRARNLRPYPRADLCPQ
jgi:hypothetical protein